MLDAYTVGRKCMPVRPARLPRTSAHISRRTRAIQFISTPTVCGALVLHRAGPANGWSMMQGTCHA
jgi:hypothetical protein